MSETTVLTQQESFDVAVCKTEIVDIDRLQYLLNTNLISSTEKKFLGKIHKRRVNGRFVDVTYILGVKGKTEFLGRFGPKGGVGLQNVSRDIRAFLTQTNYWDVDMRNAQPNLLLQYAEKIGLEHTHLKKFCATREDVLIETMSLLMCNRDEAKQRYISLFFGGSNVDDLPDWIRNGLYPELCKIKNNIFISNQHISKKLKNDANSVMAYVLQTIERKCLMAMDRAFTLKARSVDVLIHDGGLVRKLTDEKDLPVDLLRHAEWYIFKETGYKVELVSKPIVSSFVMEKIGDILDEDVIVDDTYAARKFVELMGDNILLCDELVYMFDDTTGIWSCDEGILNRKITEAGDKLVFKQQTPTGVRLFNYSGIVKNCESLKKKLPSVLEPNNTFLSEGRKKAVKKLLFKNGIYDFDNGFKPYFDNTIVFSSGSHRDYEGEVDEEDIKFVTNALFVDPFSNKDTPDVFLHYLMRGVIGDFRCKKFIVALGDMNSSKGTMTEVLGEVLGSKVATTFNADCLLAKTIQGDAERELSFVGKFCNSRLAFSNEITNVEKSTINGNILKSIVSGGEPLTIRNLYMNSQSVVNYCMPVIFAQDLPKITPADAISGRLIVIQYDYSFVEHPTLPNQKLADPNIKDTLKNAKNTNAFTHILIREYEKWKATGFKEIELPEFMMEDKQILAPTVNILHLLEERFDITGDKSDYVELKTITKFLKDNGVTMSDTRVGRELTRLGLDSTQMCVDRKRFRVRLGLKERE